MPIRLHNRIGKAERVSDPCEIEKPKGNNSVCFKCPYPDCIEGGSGKTCELVKEEKINNSTEK